MVGSQQYAITATRQIVAQAPAGPATAPAGQVWLLPDATNDIYLGGSNVTSSIGLKLLHGTALVGPIILYTGDALYAVTASTATLGVLQT